MRGVRPCTLVAIGIKSGDTPEVRAGLEIAEVEALDLRGGAGEVVHITRDNLDKLPRCREPNVQMFVELATCGEADVLVTGDNDLLELAKGCELTIETPAEFKKRFD